MVSSKLHGCMALSFWVSMFDISGWLSFSNACGGSSFCPALQLCHRSATSRTVVSCDFLPTFPNWAVFKTSAGWWLARVFLNQDTADSHHLWTVTPIHQYIIMEWQTVLNCSNNPSPEMNSQFLGYFRFGVGGRDYQMMSDDVAIYST